MALMNLPKSRVAVVIVATIAVLFAAGPTDSCSFYDPVVLGFEKRPDAPLSRYAAGRLGLLLGSFARSHLVIAWRHLSGVPLSEGEQEGYVSLAENRIAYKRTLIDAEAAAKEWTDARNAAAAGTPAIRPPTVWIETSNYESVLNCPADAFFTAKATLQDRSKRFGAGSPAVKSWLRAQDVVFDRCNDGKDLPPAAEAALPKLMQKDRAYQIAAATFYSRDFDTARTRFNAIASDSESPWSDTAALVAARSLIRKATLVEFDRDLLTRANDELGALLANPRRSSVHEAARRLRNYIGTRRTPEETLHATAARLGKRDGSSSRFLNDLADYTILRDQEVAATDEMSAWIDNIKADSGEDEKPDPEKIAAAFGEALGRWHKGHALPWLVAALSHASGDEKEAPELLDAAKQVPATSPAYVTTTVHRLRLLHHLKRDGEWRSAVDAALELGDDVVPPGSRNILRGLRLPMAASLGAFLRDAPRAGVGYDSQSDPDSPKQVLYFDADAVTAINQSLPLEVLVTAARDPKVDERLHRALLVAAWTRAWLLDRDDVAASLSPALQALFPELTKPLETYLKAAPADRHYEGLHLLVRFPGLLPHVRFFQGRDFTTPLGDVPHDQMTHDNWWCTDGFPFGSVNYPEYYPMPSVVVPAFAQVPAIRAQAVAEQKTLRERGSGPTFLLRGLMAWSEARPADPRIADDLALAIRTTQWACPDSKTRTTAHAAYDFLHSHYPKSEAATRTRYWYDGKN